MRKLRMMQHLSLDGVIQQTADGGDFPHTDWTVPYRTPAGREAVLAAYGDRYDLLLGRRTYDLWSEFWPTAPSSPMVNSFNRATKYVVTHHPDSLGWGPVEALGPEVVADVRRLKAGDGPDLILAGSSTLTSTLLGHGLVEELVLIVYPVLLGTGRRFFAEGTPARLLQLVSSEALPSGVVFLTYQVAGPLKAG